MVKIPNIVISGPKDKVAICVTLVPRTPINTLLNAMYKMIGIRVPMMIAFLVIFLVP